MNELDLAAAPCSECGGELARRAISQEFERDGVRVEVAGVRALVCEKCGAIYFEPGGAQALTEAVNGLFKVARVNHQHKGKIVAKATPSRAKKKVAADARVLAPASETENQPLKTDDPQENYVFNCS